MADTRFSGLTAATSFLDADEFVLNESGTTKKCTGTLLKDWIGNCLQNQSTSAQTINASTTAYLTHSNIAVPAAKLRIGTVFHWRVQVNKTALGTNNVSFIVKVGTLGTTSDTSVLTFSLPTATAAADEGWIDIMVTCRGPLSASGIFQGVLRMTHNLNTTGLANIPCVEVAVTSSAFDVTTANLIVGLTCTTPASTTLLFRQVVVEARNL